MKPSSEVARSHAGQVRYDTRNAVAGLPRGFAVEFLRHALGRRRRAVVAYRSTLPFGVLVAVGAAIAASEQGVLPKLFLSVMVTPANGASASRGTVRRGTHKRIYETAVRGD